MLPELLSATEVFVKDCASLSDYIYPNLANDQ